MLHSLLNSRVFEYLSIVPCTIGSSLRDQPPVDLSRGQSYGTPPYCDVSLDSKIGCEIGFPPNISKNTQALSNRFIQNLVIT